MLDIAIDSQFAERGLVVTLGLTSARLTVQPGGGDLDSALAAAAAARRDSLGGRPVAELPAVAETRKAYKALGKDPSRYRPSSEALIRRIAQDKPLFRINNAVDCNNLISIETGLPSGCYDLESLEPPVVFRPGQASESYAAIGRGEFNLEKLPLFADSRGPFGSPTSDSERSMITADCRQIVMVLIGFGPDPGISAGLERVAVALAAHCGATELEQDTVTNA